MQLVPSLFHKEGDGVKANKLGTTCSVEHQNIYELNQHVRVGEVQINLIGAECGPDVTDSGVGGHARDQRTAARAHDRQSVRLFRQGNKVVFSRRLPGYKVCKPQILSGTVIDDEVEHEVVVIREFTDAVPGTGVMIYTAVVDNCKSVVGRRWKKWQQVYGPKYLANIFAEKVAQCVHRQFIVCPDGVCVGDEQRFAPRRGWQRLRFYSTDQLLCCAASHLWCVEFFEQGRHSLQCFLLIDIAPGVHTANSSLYQPHNSLVWRLGKGII